MCFFKVDVFFYEHSSKDLESCKKTQHKHPLSLSTCYNQCLAAAPRAPHCPSTGWLPARGSGALGILPSWGQRRQQARRAAAPRQWGEPRPSCGQSRGSEPRGPPGSHVSWAGKCRASGPVTPKRLPCVRGSLPVLTQQVREHFLLCSEVRKSGWASAWLTAGREPFAVSNVQDHLWKHKWNSLI